MVTGFNSILSRIWARGTIAPPTPSFPTTLLGPWPSYVIHREIARSRLDKRNITHSAGYQLSPFDFLWAYRITLPLHIPIRVFTHKLLQLISFVGIRICNFADMYVQKKLPAFPMKPRPIRSRI